MNQSGVNMLQNIRQHAKGWISGLLVTLISLAFALWGVQNYITGAKRDKVIAKVNSQKITDTDLKIQYQRMKQQLAAQYGSNITINENMQQMLKQQALQQLITRDVITQSALKSGYAISPDQLMYVIHSMPTFQYDGKFSYPRFRQIINSMGYSEETFLEEMDHNLLYGQLRSGIEATAFSLSNEIEQAIFLSEQERDFNYAVIDAKRFEKDIKIDEDRVKSYYEQNRKDFESGEKVSLEYVVLSSDAIKKTINVDDNDIKNYYEANTVLSMTPREWDVEQIIVPIALDADDPQVNEAKALINEASDSYKKYKDFSKLEAEMKVKNKNIRLETDSFKADREHSNLVKYVGKLKAGDVTQPFRTEKGFHLIKIKAIKEPKQIPFADVKDKLREGLIKQKVEQAFVAQTDELTELAYTNPDSLKPVVEALKLPLQQTQLFGREGLEDGVESNPKVLQVAFSDDILEGGNNSQPIEIGNGKVIVFRVKDHMPVKVRPFEQVKDQIIAKLTHQEAQDKAEALSKQIVESLNKGEDAAKLATQYNFKWDEANSVNRQSLDVDREVSALAFGLPDPKAINKSPADSGPMASGDYAIVQLKSVNHKEATKLTNEQRKVIEEALRSGYGRLEFDLLVKSLKDRAKIKILGQ